MPAAPALSCPSCRKVLDELSWHDAGGGACRACQEDFKFVPFPALTASRRVMRAQKVTAGEDATCFFHHENQADAACDGCGRFLCRICSVDFMGERLCAPCIAGKRERDAKIVTSRLLYDGIAFGLATFPLLMWPITLVTAPATLAVVVIGWKKPGSLVRGGRWRMFVAAGLAVLQIGGWITGFVVALDT